MVLIAHINGIENPLSGQALKNNKISVSFVFSSKNESRFKYGFY
jgi:hypothetical protein